MSAEVIVRTYSGANQAEASRLYGEDALALADDGWVAVSQAWVAGEWSTAQYAIAALLVLVGIGILLLILFWLVKPTRTLMVTYHRPSRRTA